MNNQVIGVLVSGREVSRDYNLYMNKRDTGMRGSHMADFFLLGSNVKLELELKQQSTCKVW